MTAAPDDPLTAGDNIAADAPSQQSGSTTREILITNKRGLHARASAKFVQLVERLTPMSP